MSNFSTKKLIIFMISLLLLLCSYLHSLTGTNNGPLSSPLCSLDMFDRDINAYRSCMTAFALQHNWYPSPIAGLYQYTTWNGFDGFWQDGTVLETLANFMAYGNNTMYKSVIDGSLRNLSILTHAYAPQPSYDDMAWFAISYLRIYEVLQSRGQDGAEFLKISREIYDWIWQNGWDHNKTCGGGFWFDQSKKEKKTVENVQMLLIGGKLYRESGDKNLMKQINRTWNFLEQNNVTNKQTYLVSDGIKSDCGPDDEYGPSYNMGLMIGGLLHAGASLNREGEFVQLAQNIAEASNKFISRSGIVVEYCTPYCNDDQKMFKGIYMRNLRYLIDFMETNKMYNNAKKIAYYRSVMEYNSDSVWRYNRCDTTNKGFCNVIYKDGPSLNNNTVGPISEAHSTKLLQCNRLQCWICLLPVFRRKRSAEEEGVLLILLSLTRESLIVKTTHVLILKSAANHSTLTHVAPVGKHVVKECVCEAYKS